MTDTPDGSLMQAGEEIMNYNDMFPDCLDTSGERIRQHSVIRYYLSLYLIPLDSILSRQDGVQIADCVDVR